MGGATGEIEPEDVVSPGIFVNRTVVVSDACPRTENGILGVGQKAEPDERDPDLVNAGRQLVTLRPGASFFHHADSCGAMDLAVGAKRVSST